VKVTLVLVLSAIHVYLAVLAPTFAKDCNRRPVRFYRIVNEVPTLLMALIVFFVVFKPL
jgi:putative membrane protein